MIGYREGVRATIERCAQVADEYGGWGPHIAAAIRALATETPAATAKPGSGRPAKPGK